MKAAILAVLVASCCSTLPRVTAPVFPVQTPSPSGAPSEQPIPTASSSGYGESDPVTSGAPLSGKASWFSTGTDGMYAAAGPALRKALGPKWRGQSVKVCLERCVRVKLNDWCQCYRGTATERLLDLSDEAFARLAPLSRGLVRVTVYR